jgi:ribosome-binding factor A
MKKPPTQRQQKVAELLRRTLSEMFMRGEIPLKGVSVTVSEVDIAPDLCNATAYIYPLGGVGKADLIERLEVFRPFVRHYVAKNVQLRHAPEILFRIDNSYEEGDRIARLLNKP